MYPSDVRGIKGPDFPDTGLRYLQKMSFLRLTKEEGFICIRLHFSGTKVPCPLSRSWKGGATRRSAKSETEPGSRASLSYCHWLWFHTQARLRHISPSGREPHGTKGSVSLQKKSQEGPATWTQEDVALFSRSSCI